MNAMLEGFFDYLRGMWRRRFIGLAVAWAVVVVGAIAVLVMPDQYEATARLYVDTQSVLKPLMAGLAVQPNVDQQVAMLSRTLLSRPNVEKLVRMADLDLDIQTPERRDLLVDRLVREIEIKGSAADNLYSIYSIRYRDIGADRAKRVVNALVSIFVESGLGNKRKDTEKAQQFIDEQVEGYERRLQEAERRLKDFKLRNLSVLGVGMDAVTTMVALEAELSSARLELHAAEQSRDALKRELEGEDPVFLPDPNAPSVPGKAEAGVPELDARIDKLKSDLDALLRSYTDKHPDVTGTRRILAELEKQKEEQIEARKKAAAALPTNGEGAAPGVDRNPVYQQLKLALAEAEANVASLRARLSALEGRYAQVKSTARLRPELEEELVQLNRDYLVQKANYDGLIERRESAQLTSQMEQTSSLADFRIIDPPRVSPKPVAPNRQLLLTGVLLMSLAAGAVASLAFSQMFPTFHSTRSLRQVTQRPVLGGITLQELPAAKRQRRVRLLAFVAGLAGLLALYGSVLSVLLLAARSA